MHSELHDTSEPQVIIFFGSRVESEVAVFFLARGGSSNPVGHSLSLTYPNLKYPQVHICGNTKSLATPKFKGVGVS